MKRIKLCLLMILMTVNVSYANDIKYNTDVEFDNLSFQSKANLIANKVLNNKAEDFKIKDFLYSSKNNEVNVIINSNNIIFPEGRGSSGTYNNLNKYILEIIKSFGYGRISNIKIGQYNLEKTDIINLGEMLNNEFFVFNMQNSNSVSPSFKNDEEKKSFFKMNYYSTITAKYPDIDHNISVDFLLEEKINTEKLNPPEKSTPSNASYNISEILKLIDYTARNKENYDLNKNTNYYEYDSKIKKIVIKQKKLSNGDIENILKNIIINFGTARIQNINVNNIPLQSNIINDVLTANNKVSSWSWKDFLNRDEEERYSFSLKSYTEYTSLLDEDTIFEIQMK